AFDGALVEHAQAEVMHAGGIRIVIGCAGASRSQREAELTIEVVDVRIAGNPRAHLAVAEYLQHDPIVERLGALQAPNCEIQVVDADDFDGHGWDQPWRSLCGRGGGPSGNCGRASVISNHAAL